MKDQKLSLAWHHFLSLPVCSIFYYLLHSPMLLFDIFLLDKICSMFWISHKFHKILIYVVIFYSLHSQCFFGGHKIYLLLIDCYWRSGLVWFIFSFFQSHVWHWTYQLQFTIYITTQHIWASTIYNIINNNKKFEEQLEVEYVTTSRYMCIYINILKS